MGRPIFSKTLISPLNPEVTIVCPTAAAAFMAMSPARWASSLSWSALVFPPKPSRFKLGFTSASAAAVGGAIPKFLETLAVTSSRHWPVTLSYTSVRKQLQNRGMHRQLQGLTVFVKRRNRCLPFEVDPYGLASKKRQRNVGRTGAKEDGPSVESLDTLS